MPIWKAGTFSKWKKTSDQPGNKPGNEPGNEPSEPSIDDVYNDVVNRIASRQEVTGKDTGTVDGGSRSGAGKQGGANQQRQFTNQTYNHTFTWKELMAQFISAPSSVVSTYQKVSRRTITSLTGADTTGAGAVKKGIRQEEEAFKLLFVFDSSGSMGGSVELALAEANRLIQQNYGDIDAALGVTFFANSAEYYAANLHAGNYWKISSFDDLDKPPTITKPINTLFQLAFTGGTDFNSGLAGELSKMAGKGYNVIMFTDTDIATDKDNWTHFLNFYKRHKQNMFLILNNNDSFNTVCKQLGSVPDTFSHL